MTTRTVTVKDGVRVVTLEFGDGESWTNYTIVPRSKVLQSIREQKKEGYIPHPMIPFVHSPFYSGPGRPFVHPACLYKKNRKFYVFYQHGGLDI